MAKLTITNLTSSQYFVTEIYKTLEAGESVTIDRASSDIPNMTQLIKDVSSSILSLAVAYTTEELSTGLMQPPWSVEARDMALVNATDPAAGDFTIRTAFTALGAGVPDDVTIYAANALPFKFRVLDAIAYIGTAIVITTLDVRTRAGGAGTQLANMSSAATGRQTNTLNGSVVATPGTLEGLFVRRSDRGVAGEILLHCRLEN
jgi:hypothetical protein